MIYKLTTPRSELVDRLFSQYVFVEPSQTKCNTYNSECLSGWGGGPQFKYVYFGGHGLKSLGTLVLE